MIDQEGAHPLSLSRSLAIKTNDLAHLLIFLFVCFVMLHKFKSFN